MCQAQVAHVCKRGCLRGWDLEDWGLKPARQNKVSEIPSSEPVAGHGDMHLLYLSLQEV
jgi:hypothetical protein